MAFNPGSALNNAPINTSCDAPHSEWDLVNYPRVHASSQPNEQQAAFALFYPNGLPITYQMEHGRDSGGVLQYYRENHLPGRFYTHPPQYAAAKFSTLNGQRQFRAMGPLLPERRIHLWNKDEIQSVCNSLRRVFKAELKSLQRPTRWDHLWEFFDAYDLYHYGALNLWNVVNTLYDENCIIAQRCNDEKALQVGFFVDEWIKKPQNQDALKQWNELDGPIFSILSPEDWKEIRNLEDDDTSLLKSALSHRRGILLAGNERAANRPPTDLMTACQSGEMVNWLAADSQVASQNGMPTPPPSEAVYGPPVMMNAAAPCFYQQGFQGYVPRGPDQPHAGRSTAVEELQRSADAATTKRGSVIAGNGVVIAMGSSKPPPGWEKRVKESSAFKIVEETPVGESKTLSAAELATAKTGKAADGDDTKPDAQSTERFEATVKEPRATASSPNLRSWAKSSDKAKEEPGASEVGQSKAADKKPEQKRMADSKSDQRKRTDKKPEQGKPAGSKQDKAKQADAKADKMKPADNKVDKMKPSDDKTDNIKPGDDKTYKAQPSADKAEKTKAADDKTERPRKHVSDGVKGTSREADGRNEELSTLGKAGEPDAQAPSDGKAEVSGQHASHDATAPTITVLEPAAAQQGRVQHSYALYAMPQAPGHARPQGQGDARHALADMNQGQQYGPRPAHRGRGNAPQLQLQLPRRQTYGDAQQRNYTAPGTPRGAEGQWPAEPGRRAPSTSPGGSSWYRSRGAAQARGQQSGGEAHRGSWQGSSWRSQPGPQGDGSAGQCRNTDPARKRNYQPCPCTSCAERNRGVWVNILERWDGHAADLQAHLSTAMATKFGPVDVVLPVPGRERPAFVVRFHSEASVPAALCFGRGHIPLSVHINPLHRSKWFVDNYRASSRSAPHHAAPTNTAAGYPSPQPSGGVPPFNSFPMQPAAPYVASAYPSTPYSPAMQSPDYGQHASAAGSPIHPSVRGRHGHRPSTAGPSVSPAIVTTHHGLDDEATPELPKAQSKPPSEEALEDTKPAARDAPSTPVHQRGETSPTAKARVALPTTALLGADPKGDGHDDEDLQHKKTEEDPAQEQAAVSKQSGLEEAAPMSKDKARLPSIFTEEQIKDRKQAWGRIPLPLHQHGARKPTAAASAKSGAVSHDGGDQDEVTSGCASPSIASDSNGYKTASQEVFEGRHSDKLGKRDSNSVSSDAASFTTAAPGSPSEHGMEVAQSGPLSPQPDHEDPNATRTSDARLLAMNPQGETEMASGPAQAHGQDTIKGKDRKKNKKNRMVTSTFAPSAENVPQASAPDDDGAISASTSQPDARSSESSSTRAAAGGGGDTSSLQGPMSPQGKGKAVLPTQGHAQAEAHGSKPRGGLEGAKQQYRADAGGSLKMGKKRRGRQHVLDGQSADSQGSSAEASFSRHAQPSARLNPLAQAFVSPSLSMADKNATEERYRGGPTTGAPGGHLDATDASHTKVSEPAKDVFAEEWPALPSSTLCSPALPMTGDQAGKGQTEGGKKGADGKVDG